MKEITFSSDRLTIGNKSYPLSNIKRYEFCNIADPSKVETVESETIDINPDGTVTFADVDWTKLPFYIEATVDGTLIGKSQLLSVPVAEYAKRTDELPKELIQRTWDVRSEEGYVGTLIFTESKVLLTIPNWDDHGALNLSGPYAISGYVIVSSIGTFIYDKNNGRIIGRIDDIDIISH